MKKIIGLSTLALAGVLAFTGCSISEEQGKAWAEENGYVKVDKNAYIGEYKFEYMEVVLDDAENGENTKGIYTTTTCANASTMLVDGAGTACVDASKMELKITENQILVTKDENNFWSFDGDGYLYKIDEKNRILIGCNEEGIPVLENPFAYAINEDIVHIENDRLYIGHSISVISSGKQENFKLTFSYVKK